MAERPIIAIPIGDAAGVGPEIVIRAVSSPAVNERARCLVVGDGSVLKQAMSYPGMPQLQIHKVEAPAQGSYALGVLDLIDLKSIDYENGETEPFGPSALCAARPPARILRKVLNWPCPVWWTR